MDEGMKPNDGLDQIAKEAAERAHFEFNDSAWAAMEKKLDGGNKAPFAWWKIRGPIGLLAILLLTFLWPSNGQIDDLQNQTPEQPNTESNENTSSDNEQSNSLLKENSPENTTPNQNSQTVVVELQPNQSAQENSKTILAIQNESVSDQLGVRTDRQQTTEQEVEELGLPLEKVLKMAPFG